MRCVPLYDFRKQFLTLTKEIDELVDEWTPEPLVAPQTRFEEAENEKRPVIVGYVLALSGLRTG